MNTQTLINEAISLPVEQRTQVVESLLASLNQPQSDIDAQWIKVAKHRLAEMKSGNAYTISSEEVFEKVFKRLNK